MQIWLISFVCGALLGALCESQVLMGVLCGVLPIAGFLFKNKGVLSVLGLIWGAYYNPNTTPPLKSRLTVEEPFFSFQQDALITRVGSARYIMFGRAHAGSQGIARCFDGEKLFFQTCLFFEKYQKKTLHTRASLSDRINHPISEVLGQKLNVFGRFWRGWFEAVALGKKTFLAPSLVQLFRGAGLLHLLVISGFHVSLVAGTAQMLIRAPFQMAYTLGLIKAEYWRRLHIPLLLISSCVAVLFASYVGLSGACQRALLFFLLRRWWPVFWGGGAALSETVLWTATLQSILFPIGFLSTGNLLSWGAFLLVLPLGLLRGASWKDKLLILFKTEIQLTLLVWALIGKTTAMSVWANLLLAPLFPVVFFPALFWILVPYADQLQSITAGILWLQQSYVHMVENFVASGNALFAHLQTWKANLFGRCLILIWLLPAYAAAWSRLRRRKPLKEEEESCYPSRISKEHLWNVPGKVSLS